MIFQLTKEDDDKIREWLKTEVFPPILESQKGTDVEMYHVTTDDGVTWPYLGAIGGGLTYSFTPTSLGIIVKVSFQDKHLDLTEYDMW